MLRRCLMRRRTCYLTDVEGDMSYFQRFVRQSDMLCWERRGTAAQPADPPAVIRLRDLETYQLGFKSDSQRGSPHADKDHFVFGGDAFDHGPDLTFGTALLDFKRRFPDRVHLILGNRDINKMVMVPLISTVADSGLSPAEAENKLFPLRREVIGAPGKKETLYTDFLANLRKDGGNDATSAAQTNTPSTPSVVDTVTFLKWALAHKMGSPNSFAHRTAELAAYHGRPVSEAEVAESYFAAARPGGVYHEYLRLGDMMVEIDGVLFVHGGVTEENMGFVPSLGAPPPGESYISRVGGRETAKTEGLDALGWAAALQEFKRVSFEEWAAQTGQRGEALRHFVFPREFIPQSCVVGSPLGREGPAYAPLTVAQYVLCSGVHTVCSGHQPCGDSPALVAQPGGLLLVHADNSYCGVGAPQPPGATDDDVKYNKRGQAVTEIIFSEAPEGADDAGAATPSRPVARVHGKLRDGTPFDFDARASRWVGRHVGDNWWVKRANTDGSGFTLCRTVDAYFHEESAAATEQEVAERWERRGPERVGGELPNQFTKEELAQTYEHRLKTKVSPPSSSL